MHSAMRWFDFLFPPRVDELTLRDVSADDFLALVAPRLVPETRPGTVALLPFSAVYVRAAIHEAKYHGNERVFELLALALADYLRDADDVGPRKSYISLVPVPLGEKRQKERGFNQVHEVLLRALRILGEEETIKIDADLLVRTRETATQVSLPRTLRQKNMKGAFVCPSKLEERSRTTFVLVDDVLTTGATLQAAIDALTDAGASHIIPLALAH